MDLKQIYKQLTNVDIEQQSQIWDERGKGYYGEYLVFCEIYKHIVGNGKILMNLNIPVDKDNTTEIDLLLIHETGLYVFEIKHYKGTIYGTDTDENWTQYFRTVKNNKFKNPIKQNEYHIKALRKIFLNVPIRSVIVFTSDECDIRVNNSNERVDICLFHDVIWILSKRFQNQNSRFGMDDIDKMFNQLSAYSPMIEPIVIDKTEADFFSWVHPVISKLEEKVKEVEREKAHWIVNAEKQKKKKRNGIIFNIAVVVLCAILSICSVLGIVHGNNKELASFKQKFLHIDEIDNEYIDSLKSYVSVSNVSLSPLTEDAVSFTARITILNDTYGVVLTENSKYIVMTNSGNVFEYDVFGEHLRYSRFSSIIRKGIRSYGDLAKVNFYGISNTKDISYIKITNIDLIKSDISQTVIKEGLEIELYSK